MSRKGGLGKGLDALIPSQESELEEVDSVNSIAIDLIDPNPNQPRFNMVTAELEELAESIREHGIIQPLIVTQNEESGRYTLIAGERRLRAAKLAQLQEVPVILRQVTDQQRLELALIENIQRADLTALETAEAFQHLSETFGLSHEEIARQVGKSRVAITNNLRLLKLPQSIKEALAAGNISEGHARAILGLSTPQAQVAALQTILKNDLNVRQTEELVKKMSGTRPDPILRPQPSPEVVALEERLRNHLGTRVTLQHGRKGGVISIHYYSDEELNMLISQILKE
jgi:ParB family transcriptional regulator, chromosome partitioning protein